MLFDRKKTNLIVEKTIQERIEKTKELLLVKGKEYIRSGDRIHNFRRAAEIDNITPERALHGMLRKQLVSYLDMLDDIEKGVKLDPEKVDEKLGDIIVYFHLQEGIIKARIDTEK